MSESPVDLMRRAAEVLWTNDSLLPSGISALVYDHLIECAEAVERGSAPQGLVEADEVLALAEQRRVVICASLRQRNDIAAVAEDEWRQGHWVFAPAANPAVSPAEHDRIHRARIDQADEVIVIAKPDGTLGESTAGEMQYAKAQGKTIRRWSTASGAAPTVDPDLLRWCQWPGCLKSFHAVHGPRPEIEGRGWVYVRGTGAPVLLCPDHANAGHRPGHRDWTPGDTTLIATCRCGAEQDVTPTNQAAVMAWWCEHIETLTAAKDGETDE